VEEAAKTRELFHRRSKQRQDIVATVDADSEIPHSQPGEVEEPLSFSRHKDLPGNDINFSVGSSFEVCSSISS
jgi:hypothetical protein